MQDVFRAVKLTERIYWVGAVDWTVRDFHGYETERGTTYNAYLVLGDKVTLIDTVKKQFKNEMLARIASVIEPEKIEYIVSNHSEMDHSGSLSETIEAVKPSKVFASVMGVKALAQQLHRHDILEVQDGGTLDLGGVTLSFMETRMLHWPDSMFTYVPEEKVLFSQDGFGMHLASNERFDDQLHPEVLEFESAKYYANIILPYSPLVTKLLEKVAASGLDIRIIAPDHGPIWRRDVDKILGLYAKYAAQKPTKKAVIVYDTMWGSTAAMARALGEGLDAGGMHVKILPLAATHRSEVVADLLCAGAILVGSPTINGEMFPTVADVLTYLKGLKPRNLVSAAFGSYGWSGEAVDKINEVLKAMKLDVIGDGIKVQYVPEAKALGDCWQLGHEIAGKVGENVQ